MASSGGFRRALQNIARPQTLKDTTSNLCNLLTARLHKLLIRAKETGLPHLVEIRRIGAECEGSWVHQFPVFDVLLVYSFPGVCELVPTGPQRQFVTCEFKEPNDVPEDLRSFLTLGTNLSPNKLVRRVHAVLLTASPDLAKCESGLQVTLEREGRDLEIKVSRGQPLLTIRFLICVQIEDEYQRRTLLCPRAPQQPRDDLTEWQRYFGAEMTDKIATCDKDGGCRVDILRLLKIYVQLRHFSGIDSFFLKALLLEEETKMKEKDAWVRSKLTRRFEAVLQSLQIVLRSGHLAHPFMKDENLLGGFSVSELLRNWAIVKEDARNRELASIFCAA